ncbi:hypothetical protein COV24_04580 [candidate division WWE3 bacterium CG10_big_fil_rev_8_21_14_0_10_32_10]|uniref:UmuC domain-containing protein n=1 Tax=candidate division WWE3 bacterium CG10_big_fil_rev_8_21_14_0_10_32_10 TaxID=1975090 RepID=A0A2H0R985_UNCKA|nr:MAG: hypothetical protein COV24_04580 [candidate division WWE3 bacterium CG10_big_fil_rev_8_21_14_0_10_32_10]
MKLQKKYSFQNLIEPNSDLPYIMHLDMNGFFASCEQQQNHLLRNKPVGVVPYLSNGSTILASSYEAKRLGITTGTRVRDALKVCPKIILKLNDPPKYRYIHNKLIKVLKKYTPYVTTKSIDEAVLDMTNINFKHKYNHKQYMVGIAKQIKKDINERVGDYMRCSIGIATNRFLAKVASNINKPDGLYYLNNKNLDTFYDLLELEKLHGVGPKIKEKLNKLNIHTPKQFKNARLDILKIEFKSFGYYWHLRLLGYEIDDYVSKRRSVGHSYHLPLYSNNKTYLKGIILKLVEKIGTRLRNYDLKTRCFSFFCLYENNTTCHTSHRIKNYTNETEIIYKEILKLFIKRPTKYLKIKLIMVGTSNFVQKNYNLQNDLFGVRSEKREFYRAIDKINGQFGDFTIMPATLLLHKNSAPDRIAFGK